MPRQLTIGEARDNRIRSHLERYGVPFRVPDIAVPPDLPSDSAAMVPLPDDEVEEDMEEVQEEPVSFPVKRSLMASPELPFTLEELEGEQPARAFNHIGKVPRVGSRKDGRPVHIPPMEQMEIVNRQGSNNGTGAYVGLGQMTSRDRAALFLDG